MLPLNLACNVLVLTHDLIERRGDARYTTLQGHMHQRGTCTGQRSFMQLVSKDQSPAKSLNFKRNLTFATLTRASVATS